MSRRRVIEPEHQSLPELPAVGGQHRCLRTRACSLSGRRQAALAAPRQQPLGEVSVSSGSGRDARQIRFPVGLRFRCRPLDGVREDPLHFVEIQIAIRLMPR